MIERALAGEIARGDDALRGAVPDREGEVALEMRGAVRAPRAIRGEDEVTRRTPRGGHARARECGAEIIAIVDARVGHDGELAIRDDERITGH